MQQITQFSKTLKKLQTWNAHWFGNSVVVRDILIVTEWKYFLTGPVYETFYQLRYEGEAGDVAWRTLCLTLAITLKLSLKRVKV